MRQKLTARGLAGKSSIGMQRCVLALAAVGCLVGGAAGEEARSRGATCDDPNGDGSAPAITDADCSAVLSGTVRSRRSQERPVECYGTEEVYTLSDTTLCSLNPQSADGSSSGSCAPQSTCDTLNEGRDGMCECTYVQPGGQDTTPSGLVVDVPESCDSIVAPTSRYDNFACDLSFTVGCEWDPDVRGAPMRLASATSREACEGPADDPTGHRWGFRLSEDFVHCCEVPPTCDSPHPGLDVDRGGGIEDVLSDSGVLAEDVAHWLDEGTLNPADEPITDADCDRELPGFVRSQTNDVCTSEWGGCDIRSRSGCWDASLETFERSPRYVVTHHDTECMILGDDLPDPPDGNTNRHGRSTSGTCGSAACGWEYTAADCVENVRDSCTSTMVSVPDPYCKKRGHNEWTGNRDFWVTDDASTEEASCVSHCSTGTCDDDSSPDSIACLAAGGAWTGIPTPLAPYFLGHFSPVLRRLFAVLLRFPASWRQDGENGRKMA